MVSNFLEVLAPLKWWKDIDKDEVEREAEEI